MPCFLRLCHTYVVVHWKEMKQIDKVRSQTRELMSGSAWGQREAYYIIVNTNERDIKELVSAVAEYSTHWFGRKL